MLNKLLTSIALAAALIGPAHASGWDEGVMTGEGGRKVYTNSTYFGESSLMVGCAERTKTIIVFWVAETDIQPQHVWNVVEVWGSNGETVHVAANFAQIDGLLITAFTDVDAAEIVANGGAISIAANLGDERVFQRFTVDGPADVKGLLDKCAVKN